jgi:hypothetical protein
VGKGIHLTCLCPYPGEPGGVIKGGAWAVTTIKTDRQLTTISGAKGNIPCLVTKYAYNDDFVLAEQVPTEHCKSNMQKSKDEGVFVRQYVPLQNPYRINDTLTLHIKEAWLERCWDYVNGLVKIDSAFGYQLFVEVEEQDLKSFCRSWVIGISDGSNSRVAAKNLMMTDFGQLPDSGIFGWDVQHGMEFRKDVPKKIIGQFALKSIN